MGKVNKERLSPDAALLNKYLLHYGVLMEQKQYLVERGKQLQEDFYNPLTGIRYTDMSKTRSRLSEGSAGLPMHLVDIENRIDERLEEAEKILAQIWSIIELLPDGRMERAILEHRYIDRMSLEKICSVENLSKTPVMQYWRRGMNELAEKSLVKMILEECKKENHDNLVDKYKRIM